MIGSEGTTKEGKALRKARNSHECFHATNFECGRASVTWPASKSCDEVGGGQDAPAVSDPGSCGLRSLLLETNHVHSTLAASLSSSFYDGGRNESESNRERKQESKTKKERAAAGSAAEEGKGGRRGDENNGSRNFISRARTARKLIEEARCSGHAAPSPGGTCRDADERLGAAAVAAALEAVLLCPPQILARNSSVRKQGCFLSSLSSPPSTSYGRGAFGGHQSKGGVGVGGCGEDAEGDDAEGDHAAAAADAVKAALAWSFRDSLPDRRIADARLSSVLEESGAAADQQGPAAVAAARREKQALASNTTAAKLVEEWQDKGSTATPPLASNPDGMALSAMNFYARSGGRKSEGESDLNNPRRVDSEVVVGDENDAAAPRVCDCSRGDGSGGGVQPAGCDVVAGGGDGGGKERRRGSGSSKSSEGPGAETMPPSPVISGWASDLGTPSPVHKSDARVAAAAAKSAAKSAAKLAAAAAAAVEAAASSKAFRAGADDDGSESILAATAPALNVARGVGGCCYDSRTASTAEGEEVEKVDLDADGDSDAESVVWGESDRVGANLGKRRANLGGLAALTGVRVTSRSGRSKHAADDDDVGSVIAASDGVTGPGWRLPTGAAGHAPGIDHPDSRRSRSGSIHTGDLIDEAGPSAAALAHEKQELLFSVFGPQAAAVVSAGRASSSCHLLLEAAGRIAALPPLVRPPLAEIDRFSANAEEHRSGGGGVARNGDYDGPRAEGCAAAADAAADAAAETPRCFSPVPAPYPGVLAAASAADGKGERAALVRVGCAEAGGDGAGTASYRYRRLAGCGREWPPGVDPARREQWLCPREFEAVFAMSFADFKALPLWRRIILKQEVRLF